MNGVRADIAAYLADGLPNTRIARLCGVRHSTVREARAALGIPPHPGHIVVSGTVEDAFWRRAQWVDGHLFWPGASTADRARLYHRGTRHDVRRLAFRIGTGRDPVGPVTTTCGHAACIRPGDVEDQPMRDMFAAIFGATL